MKNQGSIEIDRSIAEVFELTTRYVAHWSIIVVEDTLLTGDGGVGSTFHTITEERGRRMEFRGEVIAHSPPSQSTIRLIGDQFDVLAEYSFEDVGGRTRVTQRAKVTGKGFFRFFLLICGWLMRAQSEETQNEDLASLKQFCENYSGAVTSA